MGRILMAWLRATPNSAALVLCAVPALAFSLAGAESHSQATQDREELCADAADKSCGRAVKLKSRKPVRLLERHALQTAGNYREIPLADAAEAMLAERASDVLQRQSGLQVNRAGAPGTQSLLGIRGSTPEQVEYFLEAMPLPKPYNAPLNLETLPLLLFDAVELYPSFVPAHLPASNIGGALNFRLRQAAQTEYLAQSTISSLEAGGIALARLSPGMLHYARVEQSRNRYSYYTDNGTPENSADDTRRMRSNEDFSTFGYTGFYRARSADWQFAALLDLQHSDRGLPGVQNQPLRAVRKLDERLSAATSASYALSTHQHLHFFSSLALDHSQLRDPQQELFFSRGQDSVAPQYLVGATYALRFAQWEAALNARGRYQNLELNGNKLALRREAQTAASCAYDRTLWRAALQASATANADEAAENAFYASGPVSFRESGAGASALVALRPLQFWQHAAQPTGDLVEIYGQVSSTYRSPSLYERFGDNVFVTPSPSLRSETAITNAGGVRGSVRCFALFYCSLRSEGWLTGAHDYILFTQNSARTLIAVNASSARIWGVESEALLNYPEHFLFSLRYTYLDARDYGSIPYYQDKFLPLRPRHHLVATLSLVYKAWRLTGSVEYRGAIFRDRYNSYHFYLKRKLLADAGIDYTLHAAARHMLSFAVRNLLDDETPDILGYTLPGRYFLLKWSAQW